MKVLIMGAGIDQVLMIKKAKELGFVVYAVDREINSVGRQYADNFINMDPKDVLNLEKIIQKEKILGIYTMASNLIPRYVSELAERCGLRSIPHESAFVATDKQEFKQVFASTNIPIVEGGVAKNKKDAMKVCQKLQFPVIFKPVDGSGCRGIHIVRDTNEVGLFFEECLSHSETKTIIIEEFLDDSLVFGVESLINNNKTFVIGIADKIVRKTSGISTVGVAMPTILKHEDINKVTKIVEDIHKELKINMGASHIDFIFHNGIPKVIDIGPRLAGGPLIFELIKKTKNIDMIKYILKQGIGEVPDPVIKEDNLSAVSLHFFSPVDGELIDYNMPDLYKNMTSSWRKEIGEYLISYGSNVDRVGYLTCVDNSVNRAKEKIIDIIRDIKITIKKVDGSIAIVSPVIPESFLA